MSGNISSSNSNGRSAPQLDPTQLLQLFNTALPSVLGTVSGQAAPTAQALGQAAYQSNPYYTASGLEQLLGFAPQYQQSGANLANAQALSTAGLLNGPGSQVASAANSLNNQYNPAQAANNSQAANLVNSINLNGLSGGEQAATERSLNQSNYATGNLGLDNATNAVSNAMNFGGAFNQKLGILGNALGASQGVASGQNSAFNPINTALGAGNTSNNFGLGTFNPTQGASTVTTPFSFGSSIFSPLSSNASSQVGKNSSSSSSVGGGASCYLTTAACEHKGLPDDCEELMTLRRFRDEFVPENVVSLYYKEAPSIVEKYRENKKVMEKIWSTASECVKLINTGFYFTAMNKYQDLVKELS